MIHQCNPSPRCIFHCRKCGNPIPEWPSERGFTDNVWLVEYENGSSHNIAGSENADEAALYSNIILARSAELCLEHLVRVREVTHLFGGKTDGKKQ